MRTYSVNWGNLLFLRWLTVSWTLQAIHTLDKTEKAFRILLEVLLVVIIAASMTLLVRSRPIWEMAFAILLSLHTVMWFLNSTMLVGLRECFRFVKNPGIEGTVSFLKYVAKVASNRGAVECVLVYGSMARCKFHDRSDLDVRIIRCKSLLPSLRLMMTAIFLRMVAILCYRIPLDLKVVDSLSFLEVEMRADERPIVVYSRPGYIVPNQGIAWQRVIADPHLVTRSSRAART